MLEGRDSRPGFIGGVGGVAGAPKGRLAWFELGGRRFEHLEAGFSQASAGATAQADEMETLGTIGMKLLGEFRLVIDYTGWRIAFLPPQ